MIKRDSSLEEAPLWRTESRRFRLECRECEVICERVVLPWHCLKSGCRYVYVYDEGDRQYFGCLNKVFGPELDLALFEPALARARSGDPFGPLKAIRPPRPECRVSIEQAYPRAADGMCYNPTFFHCPLGTADEGIRLIAAGPRRSDSAGKG